MAREYIFDILGNDKNNVSMMETTLFEIKNKLFDNMYTAEKAVTEIKRYDLTMDQYLSRTGTRCEYSVPIPLITPSYRNAFKYSKFYKQDITLSDIESNPDIFYLSLLVFINGDLYTNVNFGVKAEEATTIVSFSLFGEFYEPDPYVRPGFTQAEMNEFIETKAKMTIIALPNHQIENFETTKANLYSRTMGVNNRGIPFLNFNSVNEVVIDDNAHYLGFFTKDDNHLYQYTYADISTDTDNIYFNRDEVRALTNAYSYLKYMKFRNTLTKFDLPNDKKFFTLELHDFPVPVENIFIFRKTPDGIKFDHDTTLTLYYPNYYEVNKSHTDDLIIWAFYKDDTTYGDKHNDELRVYHRFATDILSKYEDGTIPDEIKNYKPITTTYGIEGYKSQSLDALHYKINTLIDLIRQDGDFYKIYLNKLVGYIPEYYIDVSEITDLESRRRVDSSMEDSYNVMTFEEPCYVFTFHAENKLSHYILTIGTKIFVPKYTLTKGELLYMYIPVSLVEPTSVIHVEKRYDSYYTQAITPSSIDDYIEIDAPSHMNVRAQDIFVVTKDSYVDESTYEIYTKLPDDTYKKIVHDRFYTYDNFYVKFVDSTVINTNMAVVISKINETQTKYNDSRFKLFGIDRIMDDDESNVRLFRNGMLLPREAYNIDFNQNPGGEHIVRALVSINPNDNFSLVYTNSKYDLVYKEKQINEYGIVDVFGKINKPIDLRWHDIYLNGLRITDNELEIIGPYLFRIKNVPTRLNLHIYQVDLDKDSDLNIDLDSNDISESIYQNNEEIKESLQKDIPPIVETMPDIFDDIYKDYVGLIEDVLFPLSLLNPDDAQISDKLAEKYEDLLDDRHNFLINPDIYEKSYVNPYINPDTEPYIIYIP